MGWLAMRACIPWHRAGHGLENTRPNQTPRNRSGGDKIPAEVRRYLVGARPRAVAMAGEVPHLPISPRPYSLERQRPVTAARVCLAETAAGDAGLEASGPSSASSSSSAFSVEVGSEESTLGSSYVSRSSSAPWLRNDALRFRIVLSSLAARAARNRASGRSCSLPSDNKKPPKVALDPR
eukprot:scaffold67192_cov32-Tisochrysis_lutea.AAC.4